MLDAATARDRREFFAAFLPRLADDLERAWNVLARGPYAWSEGRRAFRAPNHPRLSRGARADWLLGTLSSCTPFEQDALWFAKWADHLGGWRGGLGALLACVIDAGGARGDEVLATLTAALEGRHEIAAIGRQSIRALASCARPEAWSTLENLLLRAQREEGLRQVILESVDLAHPECFARVLRMIAENDLARFSSVARAVDVWFGMGWDSEAVRQVSSVAERAARWIPDCGARNAAIDSGVAEDVYIGLHLDAFEDAVAVVHRAQPLLRHSSHEVRYAAARLLAGLDHTAAPGALYEALGDPDLRIAALAVDLVARIPECHPERPDLFEKLEAQLERWPTKPVKSDPIVWPWCVHVLDRASIGRALLETVGERPFARLRAHADVFDSSSRAVLCGRICKGMITGDRDTRATLLDFLGDPST
ncbi:MAG: hypothetical protein IPJ19_17725, partial [Planctomycetes bacterium]|nr:hypothetical protein [Planctomycetota bacterium]